MPFEDDLFEEDFTEYFEEDDEMEEETETLEELKARSLPYKNFKGETVPVFLNVNSYLFNDTLHIGLYTITEDEESGEEYVEDWDDLTVNLPGGDSLEFNEAFLSHVCELEKLAFIEENKVGKPTGVKVHNGFCDFAQIAFDMKRLKELDPKGMVKLEEKWGVTF